MSTSATLGQLARDGGQPLRTRPFPAWPVFNEREERLLLEVLHSGKWGALAGDKVAAFEERFAAYQGARFGVGVPNGTLALHLGLQALGVGPGDEVITTPYTFIATVSTILAVGARPVFADIDPRYYTIAPAAIEAAITPRTRAIVPVHLAGHPADLDAVLDIARRHDLRVLEDACQAWGAAWRGRPVGAIGDLGAFSFQSGKNITAGEGGIVVTDDPALHELCWSLHNVGRVRDGAWYHHERLGGNLRMSEWAGAILLAQLERLPAATDLRDANARYLAAALAEVDGITPPATDPRVTRHAHHLFMVRYDAAAFGDRSRDEFVAALQAEGITPCGPGYLPLTRSPAIRHALAERFGPDRLAALPPCPATERAAAEAVWILQHALLGDRHDMDDIVAAIRKIQRTWH